ncbi:MAG TPA: hypothetical protein ENJ38_11390 [Rhodospirillales bacterium]|nr:hypothetical protein [Rhodospirillales bacterium]
MITWYVARDSRGAEILGAVAEGTSVSPKLGARILRAQERGAIVERYRRAADRAWDGGPLSERDRRILKTSGL